MDLETFMKEFWEKWALSKGALLTSNSKFLANLSFRPGEHAGHASDMAKWRLFETGALQWELRIGDA